VLPAIVSFARLSLSPWELAGPPSPSRSCRTFLRRVSA